MHKKHHLANDNDTLKVFFFAVSTDYLFNLIDRFTVIIHGCNFHSCNSKLIEEAWAQKPVICRKHQKPVCYLLIEQKANTSGKSDNWP